MDLETLSVETSGHMATITLNRPEKRNAISIRMISDLHAALDSVEKTRTRVVVLTGAGKAFCAGADRLRLEAGKTGAPRPVYPPDDPAFFEELDRRFADLGGALPASALWAGE